MFLISVKYRYAATLMSLIMQHVAPGSIVISEGWRAYQNIERHLMHETINHSVNFSDAHIQSFEIYGQQLRTRIRHSREHTTLWSNHTFVNIHGVNIMAHIESVICLSKCYKILELNLIRCYSVHIATVKYILSIFPFIVLFPFVNKKVNF